MIDRNKFFIIEKTILYLYCLMFFISYEVLKLFLGPMVLIILLRRYFYGEKLDCGSEKLKKFLLIFLIGGIVWNYLPAFDYRASRAFFKISREVLLPFYIYPIVSKDRLVIKGVIKFLTVSLLVMAGKTIVNYVTVNPSHGATGFGWVGTTRSMALAASSATLGWIISGNNKKIKAFTFLMFLLSIGIMIISKSRAGLVALGVSILFTFLISKVNLKKAAIMGVVLGMVLLFTPSKRVEHFKTTFNSERTIKNFSNGMRIELWKNAVWRIKHHPIMGSGTKQDEKLFKEYAENLPEKTKTDRYYKKKMLHGGFNDAHNMYLNMISDNGIFSLMHLALIFYILPCLCIKNLRLSNEFDRSLSLGVGASLISFYIYGMFWSIWRGDWTRMEFWFLVSLLCCVSFANNRIEETEIE